LRPAPVLNLHFHTNAATEGTFLSYFYKCFYLTGKVWSVENLPQNIIGNGKFTAANAIYCNVLCAKYLYCQSFSYNAATQECRYVMNMVAAQNASALSVNKISFYVHK
jgi:hypothetical protein